MEIYAVARPAKSQALLARFQAWIDTRTDQGIIAGSLLIGVWLIANSIYLIVADSISLTVSRPPATWPSPRPVARWG